MADLKEWFEELMNIYGNQEFEYENYNGAGTHYYYYGDSSDDTTTE